MKEFRLRRKDGPLRKPKPGRYKSLAFSEDHISLCVSEAGC
jgi:hypothetical protein